MKIFSHIYILIFSCLLLVGCDVLEISTSGKSQLVVEGWIDTDSFPIVKLSRTVPLSDERIDVGDLSKYVENWAKVTISDGTHTYIMRGRYDSKYNPPFIYTSYEMRGEVGKAYTIDVETPDGIKVRAFTSIPEPLEIKRFEVMPTDIDTLFQLNAYLEGNGRCKIFTMVSGEQTEYFSSPLGIFDRGMVGTDGKVVVKRGRNNLAEKTTPYFKRGDRVYVKLCTLDDAAYDFWRSFEDLTALSGNFLMPVSSNLCSNVDGALGYWCGYGAKVYLVDIDL